MHTKNPEGESRMVVSLIIALCIQTSFSHQIIITQWCKTGNPTVMRNQREKPKSWSISAALAVHPSVSTRASSYSCSALLLFHAVCLIHWVASSYLLKRNVFNPVKTCKNVFVFASPIKGIMKELTADNTFSSFLSLEKECQAKITYC